MFEPKAPIFKGSVQIKNQDGTYQKPPVGTVSLWKYEGTEATRTGNPAPQYKGFIEMNGQKFNLSLW